MSPRIATTTEVDRDGLLEFVRPRHRALLGTTRADGRPQLSPVTCGVGSEGRVVIPTLPQRAEVRALRKRPEVSLCVALCRSLSLCVLRGLRRAVGAGRRPRGGARPAGGPGEPLVEHFQVISGEHPDRDEHRAAMQRQGGVLIRVTPERWGPVATGAFPPGL